MGDMFIRRDDGRLDFVDRAKYMIKSGGENIYPAEIERVLLADPRVDDAVVVRKADAQVGRGAGRGDRAQGRQPQRRGASTPSAAPQLAGYKQPKEIRFVAFADLPRSTTGKIQRHEVEAWFEEAGRKPGLANHFDRDIELEAATRTGPR